MIVTDDVGYRSGVRVLEGFLAAFSMRAYDRGIMFLAKTFLGNKTSRVRSQKLRVAEGESR